MHRRGLYIRARGVASVQQRACSRAQREDCGGAVARTATPREALLLRRPGARACWRERALWCTGCWCGLVARLARCEWRCRVRVGLPGAPPRGAAAPAGSAAGPRRVSPTACAALGGSGWVGLVSSGAGWLANFLQGRSGSLGFTGRVPAGPGSTKPDQLRPQQSRIASARSPASPDSPIIPRVRRRLTPRARASRPHPILLDAAYGPAPPLRVLPPRAPFLPKRAQAAGNERRPLARGSRGSCIRFVAIARAAG